MIRTSLLEIVKPFHFRELIKKGISMDVLYLLILAESGEMLEGTSAKETALIASLKRKLFVDKDCKITEEGKTILAFLQQDEGLNITRKIIKDEIFEKWWMSYPVTDQWEHDGQEFKGDRGFRVKKEECRLKFHEILNEGDYTVDDLIGAVLYEVHLKKEKSLAIKANKLSYMQQTITYLNQRTFENFVELGRKGIPVLQSKTAPKNRTIDI